ncbi:protein spaetzle-like [Toxorhynchites rutilus septentrionalis]|uniref:protein spaetzle-like n=1 Tax=Toxorhynchites rutilus septentrionalis TaxID=329112 RepID=UPI002479A37F|nr:protein spaetzle-like [Toxorhynchites rutilus septentrionalis]
MSSLILWPKRQTSKSVFLLILFCSLVHSVPRYQPLVRRRDPSEAEQVPKLDRSKCETMYPNCTDVVNYPQQKVNEAVAPHEHRYAAFLSNEFEEESDILGKKFDTSDNEFLCDSEQIVIHPKTGLTNDGQSVFIVNTDKYMQGVRIEKCRRHGQTCNKLEHLISFLKTECMQLFQDRMMLAIDVATKQPYKAVFRWPSCCKCVIIPLKRRGKGRS